jgi:hypothetical protein
LLLSQQAISKADMIAHSFMCACTVVIVFACLRVVLGNLHVSVQPALLLLLLLQAELVAEVELPVVDACGPVDAFCGWFDVEFKVMFRLIDCSYHCKSFDYNNQIACLF